MKKPTAASLSRARWAAAREEERRIQKDYKIILALPQWVRFHYGGVIVEFKREDASPFRIYRSGYTILQLTVEDYAFLYTKAEELMQAAKRGLIEVAEAKSAQPQRAEPIQSTTASLFSTDELPIHIVPKKPRSKRRK